MATKTFPSKNDDIKCLICYSTRNPKRSANESESLIEKQLKVIFILRNVLDISPDLLEKYLEVGGNPENWVKLCERCNEEIETLRNAYVRLQNTLKLFEKKKLEVKEKVKWSYTRKRSAKKVNWDCAEITDDCRRVVAQRNDSARFAEVNPFLDGDREANRLVQSGLNSMVVRLELGDSVLKDSLFVSDDCRRKSVAMRKRSNVPKDRSRNPFISEDFEAVQLAPNSQSELNSAAELNVKQEIEDFGDYGNGDYSWDPSPTFVNSQPSVEEEHNHRSLATASSVSHEDHGDVRVFPSRNGRQPMLAYQSNVYRFDKFSLGKVLYRCWKRFDKNNSCGARLHLTTDLKDLLKTVNEHNHPPCLGTELSIDERGLTIIKRKKNKNELNTGIPARGGTADKMNEELSHCTKAGTAESQVLSAENDGEGELQILQSRNGIRPLVAYKNYLFIHSMPGLNGKVLYRCSKTGSARYARCKARLHLTQDLQKVIKVVGNHNHSPQPFPKQEDPCFDNFVIAGKNPPDINPVAKSDHQDSSCPGQSLHCPVCQAYGKIDFQKFSSSVKHVASCIAAVVDKGTSKQIGCEICKTWSCVLDNTDLPMISYFEHIIICKTGNISLEHRLVSCSLCSAERFLPFKEFVKHLHRYHQLPYRCTACSKCFRDAELALRHWDKFHIEILDTYPPPERYVQEDPHLPNVPWWCPKCSFQFSDEDSRDLHLQSCQISQTDLPKAKLSCDNCSKSYHLKEELALHRVLSHSLPFMEHPFSCNVCPQTFTGLGILKQHLRHKHDVGSLLKCTKCEAGFSKKSTLHLHMRSVHADPNDRVSCPTCGKHFNSKDSLTTHVKRVHERRYQRYCDLCGKLCATKKDFRKHVVNVHNVENHELSSESQKGAAPRKTYPCTMCDKVATSRGGLLSHVRFRHGPEKKPATVKSLVCEVCGKDRFTTKLNLTRHMKRVHERRYACVCDICGAPSTCPESLRDHKARRHGIGEVKVKEKRRKRPRPTLPKVDLNI